MAHSSALEHLKQHGRYEVLKVLGEGGAGSVMLVYDKSLTVRRAIKIINPALMRSKTMSARFLDEARIMARLESDHIVTVYSVGELNGWLYIVMNYMDGGSLIDHMAEFGALDAHQAVHVAMDVLKALEVAHTHVDDKTGEIKPVIHRDVKPGNILFSRQGRVKLADFGIAQTHEHTLALTTDGSTLGTLGYMAPEQIGDPKNRVGGAGSVDLRADLHAVGVLVWMMLSWETEKVHHPGPDNFYRTWEDEGRFAKVPGVLEEIVRKATAKDPDDRYSSAREMITQLEFARGELPETPESTKPLGAVRELWDARAEEAGGADLEQRGLSPVVEEESGGSARNHSGTIVPASDEDKQESGGVMLGPVPPEQARSATWNGDEVAPLLPFDTFSAPADDLVSSTQHDRDVEERRTASMLRFHKILKVVAVVSVLVFLLAAVATWRILREPTALVETVVQEDPITEPVEEIQDDDGLVDEITPPITEPPEEVVLVEVDDPPTPEPITPEPERVEVIEVEPELALPKPEVAKVETGVVKLILKVETDGVVLKLSGDGGSYELSASNQQASVPLGQYNATAVFDREEAASGMNVGMLTVDSGLVTITCRSQMSLCTGKNLAR